MNLLAFIASLQAQDIELYLDQGRLKVNAPQGALTDSMLARLKSDKQAIVDFLKETRGADRRAIPRRDPGAPAVMSFAQQRLWFLDQLQGAHPAYNMPAALRLRGVLDIAALRRSVQAVVDRHEILRTTFTEQAGVPCQVIAPALELPVAIVDTTEVALPGLVREHAASTFDLLRGPLIRVTVLRLSGQDHVLLINMHHIVSDGWSMGIFTGEFVQNYAAAVAGMPPLAGPLPLQYADFSAWQREWLQGAELQRQLTHWKRQLADLPPLLALPTDRPRPPVQTYAGATVGFQWSAGLSNAVRDLARTQGASLYMTLLAALQALLSRYAGQRDVALGTPVANRPRPELEGLVGLFVNTLVMRADCAPQLPFSELLQQVRTYTLAAYEHQDLPFEQLVDELKPARSMSYTPLFQVMFALQNNPIGNAMLPGLELEPVPAENRVAKFDLNFNLEDDGGPIAGGIEFNSDLFDRTTIERMARAYECLVRSIVARPEMPLRDLALLRADERAAVLTDWYSAASAPSGDCLHQLFERHARQTPAATALVYAGMRCSYAELNARANRLAHHLCTCGVGPDVRVAVCLERSIEFVVALLAVLKAGGAYVPLEPDAPIERLEAILRDAAPILLLTGEGASARLRSPGPPSVLLDRDASEWSHLPDLDPAPRASAQNLAYVIYTSGSTGAPKGVMVAHGNACSLLQGFATVAPPAAPGACTVVTPFGFDVSVWELFNALCHGEAAHVLPRGWMLEPERLAAYWIDERITTAYLPPALLEPVVAALEGAGQTPALQRLLVGVEPIDAALLDRYLALCPQLGIVNGYGPTESTVCATLHRYRSGQHAQNPVSIGRAVPGYAVYLLDGNLQPVPAGVVGELYLGGAGVTRGYLGDPARSAESFVPDPFSARPGARCYRSGDLARRLDDGNLMFVGRRDTQVKIRGFRVEPMEVDLALAAVGEVAECVTVARKDTLGSQQLVAYVVPAKGATPTAASLSAGLRERLPDYMLPAAFVLLDAMPLTSTGKIDRRALPATSQDDARDTYVAPRTPAEQRLAAIWTQVLARDQVGAHDNFFEIGGNSLLAIQVISRVRSQLDAELTVRDLFDAPTVAALARRVLAPVARDRLPPLAVVDRQQALPLSFAQQRLWFLQALEGPSATYNMPTALRFRGALDADLLRVSLQALVQRHEILRTCFVDCDGEPRLQIAEVLELALPVVDAREDEVSALARAHAAHAFDLSRGPLLRVDLLRLGECEHVLLVNIHHIVCDGWSMGVLVEEWGRLYDAFGHGQDSPLAPLPVQYADYAWWQRNCLQGEVLDEHLRYWTTQLAGAPELINLPTDRPRPPVQQFEGASETLVLPVALSQRIGQLSQDADASVFMTLLSAFALLMSRYSGQADVLIGTPSANRHREQLEGLIGIFLDSLVLRVDLAGQPAFGELLGRVKQTALDAYAHAALPFERIVEALPLQRDLSRNPLFQVFFNMLNLPEGDHRIDGLEVEGLDAGHFDAKFDLTLYAQEQPSGLELNLVYNRNLFDAGRMAELLRQYAALLEQIVAKPAARIGDYTLVTAHARQVLPDPAAVLDGTWHGAVHQRFAQQVAQTPDAWAVVSHECRWRYRDLDEYSERIACHLQAAGVGRGDAVAICASRNATLVAAVLGVLKAGAAFMILDTAYSIGHLRACLDVAPARAWLQVAADADRSELAELAARSPVWLDLRDIDETPQLQRFAGQRAQPVALDPDDLALVAFTSGSTGKPKAVDGRHGSLTHFMPWMQRRFALGTNERFSMLSGLAHDPLQRDIFTALWLGGSVHIPEAETIAPGALAQWMAAEHITVANLTPAMAQVLTENPDAKVLPALRHAFLVGDVLTRRDVQRLQQLAPAARVVNCYGTTETQRALSHYDTSVETADQARREVIPLGGSNDGMQLLVLDTAGKQAGIGEYGEVWVRSPHLARGYRDDPVLTAQRFVPNPFGGSPTDRLYRTGDLGRYLPDGMVECLGRADTQVQLRGFRVELGHIESLLGQHPGVREVVVMVQSVAPTERYLVAYVAGALAPLAAAELREYLRTRLPDYMQPAEYVFLPGLPLTPNGKVDRKALPAADFQAARQGYLAPRTEQEAKLAAVWQDVLKRGQVGVHDDFFSLGGHSLLAMQLMVRVRESFGVELPLRQIFATPTIAGMVNQLDGRSQAWSPAVPVQQGSSGDAPLFIVHPLAGSVLSYAELARELGTQTTVYGLQARGLEAGQRPLERIEDMATLYVQAIGQIQPRGPYWLAGYSLGGTIAVEMARQLRDAGEQVAFLGLLDAYPPGPRQRPGQAALMANLWGGELQFAEADLLPLDERQRIAFVLDRARGAAVLPPGYGYDEAVRQVRVIEANARAMDAHMAKPYGGEVTLYQATANASPVSAQDWRPYVHGRIRVQRVPGDHLNMLAAPQVAVLAAILRAGIVQARSQMSPEPA